MPWIVLNVLLGVGIVFLARQVFQLSNHLLESERQRFEAREELESRLGVLEERIQELEHREERFHAELEQQFRMLRRQNLIMATSSPPDPEPPDDVHEKLLRLFPKESEQRQDEPEQEPPTAFERILKDDS